MLQGLLFNLTVAQGADIVTLGNALGKIQHGAIGFADAVVTAHGDVAEGGDLLIGAAGLLPGLYQGAVVEVDVQSIIGGFQKIKSRFQKEEPPPKSAVVLDVYFLTL